MISSLDRSSLRPHRRSPVTPSLRRSGSNCEDTHHTRGCLMCLSHVVHMSVLDDAYACRNSPMFSLSNSAVALAWNPHRESSLAPVAHRREWCCIMLASICRSVTGVPIGVVGTTARGRARVACVCCSTRACTTRVSSDCCIGFCARSASNVSRFPHPFWLNQRK
jgi:hypothetical protein